MMTVAVFHSVLGLRLVEENAAERLRSRGFDVALADLYAGERTESLNAGFQLMAEIGWPMICRRASEAMKELPDSTILLGFSMGAGAISSLWHERSKSKAVILFHGLADVPRNVTPRLRVQTHISSADRFVSTEQRTVWAQATKNANLMVENYNYSGEKHFFTDCNSADYSAADSELAWRRVFDFLSQL